MRIPELKNYRNSNGGDDVLQNNNNKYKLHLRIYNRHSEWCFISHTKNQSKNWRREEEKKKRNNG